MAAKKYHVLNPLKHDGTAYGPGDKIEAGTEKGQFKPAQVARLLELKVIGERSDVAEPATA